jgi:signal peptidase I
VGVGRVEHTGAASQDGWVRFAVVPDDDQPPNEPAEPSDDTPADDDATTSSSTPVKSKRRAPLWLETIVLLVVALVMALLIKTFFVQAFYIPSASMEPGLVKDDRILVQKPSYWFGEPSRGDVIVFQDPGGWLNTPDTGPQTLLAKGLAKVGLYPTGGHLVKRVIGTPGDTIVCCDQQGRLEINGVAIDEDDFIRDQPDCDGPMVNGCRRNWTVTVPDDRLFVMGDNRAASEDSSARLCAPRAKECDTDRAFVPIDLVVGKVFSLVWPLKHAEFIGRPDVFDEVPDS